MDGTTTAAIPQHIRKLRCRSPFLLRHYYFEESAIIYKLAAVLLVDANRHNDGQLGGLYGTAKIEMTNDEPIFVITILRRLQSFSLFRWSRKERYKKR